MDKQTENGFSSKTSQAGAMKKQIPYSVETPYGFHLDLDFLKYVEDIERGKTIKKVHVQRRNKGPKFSTLPRNFSLPGNTYQPGPQANMWASSGSLGSIGKNQAMEVRQIFDFQACDSRSAVSPKATRIGYSSRRPMEDPSIRAFDEQSLGFHVRPHLLRASSMPVTVLQRRNSELEDPELPAAWEPTEESGSSENVFYSSNVENNRSPSQGVNFNVQQLQSVLQKVRELEEEVQTIPQLKAQISALREEKEQCLLRLFQNVQHAESNRADAQKQAAELDKACISAGRAAGQQVPEDQETAHKDPSEEKTKQLELKVKTLPALELHEEGDRIKSQEVHVSVTQDDNVEDRTIAELQTKLTALEQKFEESNRELDRVNTLLRDQMEENRLMKERLKQKVEMKMELAGGDQKPANLGETKPSDHSHTCELPAMTNSEQEVPSKKAASMEEASFSEPRFPANKHLKDLKTAATQTDVSKTQDSEVLANVSMAEKLVEATVTMRDVAVDTDSEGISSSGLTEEDPQCMESDGVKGGLMETGSQHEANTECVAQDQKEDRQPVEVTISRYVTEIQDLLQEQWVYLPSGPSESTSSSPKDLTSKMSSIQAQLMSTVNALSSICSSSGHVAAPTKEGALRSIMKKNGGAERLSAAGAKKNLKFVGVNGGYETTSSEDSSDEDNAEVDVFEPEKQEEDGGEQTEEATEPANTVTPPEPSTGSQTKQSGRKVVDEKFMAACHLLKDRLEEMDSPNEEMRRCLSTLYQDWFRVSSRRASQEDTVALYLDAVRRATPTFLHFIINLADGNDNTALHYSVSHSNFRIVKLLLDTGLCEVNRQNQAGYTAIMLASLAVADGPEDVAVAIQLMKLGDVNARASQGGQTALMLASSHGRVAMVRPLLDCGADPNMPDNSGATALMCACEQGHTDVVRMLLACGHCDAGIADEDGNTALSVATKASHSEIVDLLRSHAVSGASDASEAL